MYKSILRPKVRGFTLIELLVVIAIIGILTSIILASLSGAKSSARDAKRISDIKNIQTSLSLYYNDNLQYPLILSTLVPAYMPVMPKDPDGSDYRYSAYNASGTSNCSSNLPVRYHLGASTEVIKDTALPTDDLDWYVGSGSACTGSQSTKFHGAAANCVGTSAASTDNCYDVTSN
jgi:prepilin-type N-terminal cleavage/methylation domain-containing protein